MGSPPYIFIARRVFIHEQLCGSNKENGISQRRIIQTQHYIP